MDTTEKKQNYIVDNYEIFNLITQTDENDNKTTKVVFGNYYIKEFETIEQAKEWIDKKDWELISATISIYIDVATKLKKTKGGVKQ